MNEVFILKTGEVWLPKNSFPHLFIMMNTITKCNLCGQEFFLDDDLLAERKKRHEERHDATKYRTGANIIRGKVKWLLQWKKNLLIDYL